MTSIAARRCVCTPLLLTVLVAAGPALAQDSDAAPFGAEPGKKSSRTLNGHTFMPAEDVQGALITTSFASGFVAGVGSTTATWQTPNQTLSGTFEYAGIGAVLGYEYAFTRNFSARAGLSEVIYSGITGKSAVVVGSNMQAGGAAGATYSLPFLEDRLRAGIIFDASFTPNLGLTIGSAIKSVIDTCESPSGCEVHAGDAFQKKMLLQLKPGLAASWAPTKALGVTGNAVYVYASTDINGKTSASNALQLATAVDYDFAAISSVPIGLQVQFNWLAPSGGDLQHVTDLGGGVFYTGKKELALGVQVLARQFRVNPDVNVSWNTYIAIIGMRYYW